MTSDSPKNSKRPPKKNYDDVAKMLRDNLLRRKKQVRERAEQKNDDANTSVTMEESSLSLDP